MKTLSKIKQDLEFNKGLFTLVETLKAIAASQYRILEKKIRSLEDFISAIEGFFELIDIRRVGHPFLQSRNKPQIVVAITSDTGLLGGLNMQITGTALGELESISGKLVVIGERGKMYAQGSGIPSVNFPGISDEERYGQAMQLRDYILSKVLSGAFGGVKVVYPRPISFTVQRVEVVSFLPFSLPKSEGRRNFMDGAIMESVPRDAVEYLVNLWMGHRLYEIFGLSRLAEFAARYVHLEESAQKIKDIDKKTRLQYFRVKHELVDRTMRELFAGRTIYAK